MKVKIENMPTDSARPRCPGCGKPARFLTTDLREGPDAKGKSRVVRRSFLGWNAYTKHAFCSLRCALSYAAYMFEKHGTRLTPVKEKP